MEFIAHRINTIEELQKIPFDCGVELDLRDYQNRLILEHNPFKDGEDFQAYLKYYKHGTMILNIKSENIEQRVLELIKKYAIKKYFFLDSSFPVIYQLAKNKEKNVAVRFSEFECLDTVLSMAGLLDWVWVDCFTKLPIDRGSYSVFKNAGFKLCLVSPELQGRRGDMETYRDYLKKEGIVFDAVCSKFYNFKKWFL